MTDIEYIRDKLSQDELLAQLAEEAAELGHAALKMRRVIDGRNPTPVTLEEAQEMLEEEAADVMLCFLLLGIDWNDPAFGNRVAHKMTRWIERLREKEGEHRG
jgi:NTP pyrophosphatase (non-canonical NTP hydrolase)